MLGLLAIDKIICRIAFDCSKSTVAAAAKSIRGPSLAVAYPVSTRPARAALTVGLVQRMLCIRLVVNAGSCGH